MFFVYLDNNTTSSDNSPWDDEAKIINPYLDEIVACLEEVGGPIVLEATIPDAMGGLPDGSFLQIRVESGSSVVIDSIYVTGSPREKATCESTSDTGGDTGADTGGADTGADLPVQITPAHLNNCHLV